MDDNEIKVIELDSHNYNNRNGYDANFLEKKVPQPSITDDLIDDVAKLKNSNNEELKYTNFSAVMSKSRGLALYTAVNINGSKLQQVDRDKDLWYYDPRIEKEFQYGPELI